jgi:hypothetical protein
VNAGETRNGDELRTKDLVPERLDRGNLREEAMSADVETVPVVFRRSRNSTDHVIGFEDRDANAVPGEKVGSGETGGTTADDNDVVPGLKSIHAALRRKAIRTHVCSAALISAMPRRAGGTPLGRRA